MNNIFSWSRFGALAVRDFAENKRRYLYMSGILVVFFILLFAAKYINGGMHPEPLVMIGGVVVALVSGAFCFKPYAQKGRQVEALTLPASVFEKYLYAWIQSLAVTLVVYWGLFFLINRIAGLIMPSLAVTLANFGGSAWPIVWGMAGIHSLAVFVHTTFRKPVFGYFLAGMSLLFFLFMYHLVIKMFFAREGGVGGNLDLGTIDSFRVIVSQQGNAYVQYMVSGLSDYRSFIIIVISLWFVMFWVTGYFKLKERQLK